MTEDQKKKLKALDKKYLWKGVESGLVICLFCIIGIILSISVNHYLFQSPNRGFSVVSGLITWLFCGRMVISFSRKTKKEIEEDIRKIFEE
jgi:hypothetical protein